MRTPPRYDRTRPERMHTVMDAHGNPTRTLHRGDGESTRAWFLRRKAADEAQAAKDAS